MREHLGTPQNTDKNAGCSAETRRKLTLHTENTENTAKAIRAAKYVMRSPLFGQCNLVPQDGLEPAGYTIGYVELEDEAGKLVMAFYQDGAWRGRNLKPFPAPVVCWYKMVRADGSEPF